MVKGISHANEAVVNLTWGVCTVKRGPDTCGWRMRMGKRGWKKIRITKKVRRKKKREMRMAKKINKQTKERNLSFKSLSRGWTLHLHTERDANS